LPCWWAWIGSASGWRFEKERKDGRGNPEFTLRLGSTGEWPARNRRIHKIRDSGFEIRKFS
jgi:hypothetical protein